MHTVEQVVEGRDELARILEGVQQLPDDRREAALRLNQGIEDLVRTCPEQYLWGYNRYKRPAGGFCVWLDVSDRGGEEAVTVQLYRDAGVRVIPGSYLARPQANGFNPGAGYIRLALVSDSESTAEALHRLVETLG